MVLNVLRVSFLI